MTKSIISGDTESRVTETPMHHDAINQANKPKRSKFTFSAERAKRFISVPSRVRNFKLSSMLPKCIVGERYKSVKMYYKRVDDNLNNLNRREKKQAKEAINREVENQVTKFQARVRTVIQQRKLVKADKLREFLKTPVRGGSASRDNPSFLVGGNIPSPKSKSEAKAFPEKNYASRDEHRRIFETLLAEGLLSKSNPNYDDLLATVVATEEKLLDWVHTHKKNSEDERVQQLLDALYDDKNAKKFDVNNQVEQFTNGIAQAKADNNELMLSATRCAGLVQCVGWLSDQLSQGPAYTQDRKNIEIYSKHPFFQEENGRGRVENERANDGTLFKGIIKSEDYIKPDQKLKNPALQTKAQIANKPEHSLVKKQAPEGIDGWLANDTVRAMPFVNSVSGLGLISSLPDAMGLLPDDPDEKMQLMGAIAAAQLYTVGGHSFFEFMEGIRLGQDAQSFDASSTIDGAAAFSEHVEQGTLPAGGHDFTYEKFIDSIPSEVLLSTAGQMDTRNEGVFEQNL